jgi:hypothetical protein
VLQKYNSCGLWDEVGKHFTLKIDSEKLPDGIDVSTIPDNLCATAPEGAPTQLEPKDLSMLRDAGVGYIARDNGMVVRLTRNTPQMWWELDNLKLPKQFESSDRLFKSVARGYGYGPLASYGSFDCFRTGFRQRECTRETQEHVVVSVLSVSFEVYSLDY